MASDPKFVQRVLDAIDKRDGEAIEGLRSDKVDENMDAILATWRKTLPWDAKDLYVGLFMDQKDVKLEPMMLDALESPNVDTRAPAICYLAGSFKLFSTFLTAGGWADPAKVDAAIAKWRNDTGQSASRACGRCGAPHVANDSECRFCHAPLKSAAEDPGLFRVGSSTFDVRVGVPGEGDLPSNLRVQNAVKRGRAAVRISAVVGAFPGAQVHVAVYERKGGTIASTAFFEATTTCNENISYVSWACPNAGEFDAVVSRSDRGAILGRVAFRVVL